MLNKLLLICILFTVSTIGCQKSGGTQDHPPTPRHNLDIDGEVQLRGEVSWIDSTNELKTKIWLENTGSDTARIETGPCAFNVLAYTTSEEEQELVWYNKMPEDYICFDEMLVYTIPLNDTIQLEEQVYISGNKWLWSIPQGKWKFVLKANTKEGKYIEADANILTIN